MDKYQNDTERLNALIQYIDNTIGDYEKNIKWDEWFLFGFIPLYIRKR